MIAFLDPPIRTQGTDCLRCGGRLKPHPTTGRDYCPGCVGREVTRFLARQPAPAPERFSFGGRRGGYVLVLGIYLSVRMFGILEHSPSAPSRTAAYPFGSSARTTDAGGSSGLPSGGPAAAARDPAQTAYVALRFAGLAENRGDWSAAAGYYRSALRIAPSSWADRQKTEQALAAAEAKSKK